MNIFFFFVYDDDTNTTVPVEVSDISSLDEQELEFFFDDKVRKVWHSKEEEWYFSIVDVCQVLTDSPSYQQARNYWKVLKSRLISEGFEPVTKCNQFKMKAADGKMRLTDAANTEQLLRIIQSIPSKKAEPFKQWLAYVGKQRLDEEIDPQIAIDRAIESYRKKGYSEAWISQRLRGIDIRKEITNTELVLNALAEISTTEISKATNPQGLSEATDATIQGGNIAKNARESLEKQIGRSVLSPLNSHTPNLLDDK